MHYEEKQKHTKKEFSPLVSIITPLYNASNYISDTISSIQKQSYSNWEHLIVDDCSTDNSVKLVESLASNDTRIKLFKISKNNGAAFCRNYATNQAKGDYIAFLDSDDLWHSEKLERQISFMIKQSCYLV